MDPQVIGRYLPVYGRAVLVTVEVSALGILLAIAIGLLCASVRYARVPAVGRLAGGYVQLARNTPLIVLLSSPSPLPLLPLLLSCPHENGVTDWTRADIHAALREAVRAGITTAAPAALTARPPRPSRRAQS